MIETAANATFLYERIAGLTKSVTPDKEQFEKWEKFVTAGGDPGMFDLRLSLSNLDRKSALKLTGKQVWSNPENLPDWASSFNELTSLFPFTQEIRGADEIYKRTKPEIGINNFSRNMMPFLSYGESLLPSLETINESLTEDAVFDIKANLLCEITSLCSSTFKSEFRTWNLKNNPAALFAAKVNLSEFSQHLFKGGWRDILLSYTVLTRQIHTICENWAKNISFMLCKLKENQSELISTGLISRENGKITKLVLNAGDSHNNGRKVMVISFENGHKLVFKPRSLIIDRSFVYFLQWLKDMGYNHTIKTPRILFKSDSETDYGFVEFVENISLTDESGFARFYKRMGELAALIYVFGGNDFHRENVIAWGEYPVLVDTETLLIARVRPFDETISGNSLALDMLSNSAIRSGLFPFWEKDKQTGEVKNHGSLYVYDDLGNTPRLGEDRRSVEMYEENFKEGFKELYTFLASRKDILLSDHSPLMLFSDADFRFLARPTQVYGDVLEYMTGFVKDGFDYSIGAERLAIAFLLTAKGQTLKNVWGLYECEYNALVKMDIPAFYGNATSLLASSVDRHNIPYFSLSAIDNAKEICSRLSIEDLKNQLDLIDAAFGLMLDSIHSNVTENTSVNHLPVDFKLLNDTQMIDEATKIYKQIMASAIGDEEPAWIVTQESTDGLTLGLMSPAFYDGRLGLCVFFSALYNITGDEGIKQNVKRIIRDIIESVDNTNTVFPVTRLPLGLTNGLGGLIRGLDLTAMYLNIDLSDTISKISITRDKINTDNAFDVCGGAAGLSIAAYHIRDKNLLEYCARHILKKQNKETGGWDINDMPALSGLGHGAAGMALALLRGYEVTGDDILIKAAESAIDFENTMYDDEYFNWRDERDTSKTGPMFMQGWCSGAPGIGLARLAGLPVLDNVIIRRDIANAVIQSKKDFTGSDHYCCGQTGRLDFLIEAGFLEDAKILMSRVVARSFLNNGYTFNINKIGAKASPSLFHGTSGVAYALLRCISPDTIKSILY